MDSLFNSSNWVLQVHIRTPPDASPENVGVFVGSDPTDSVTALCWVRSSTSFQMVYTRRGKEQTPTHETQPKTGNPERQEKERKGRPTENRTRPADKGEDRSSWTNLRRRKPTTTSARNGPNLPGERRTHDASTTHAEFVRPSAFKLQPSGRLKSGAQFQPHRETRKESHQRNAASSLLSFAEKKLLSWLPTVQRHWKRKSDTLNTSTSTGENQKGQQFTLLRRITNSKVFPSNAS